MQSVHVSVMVPSEIVQLPFSQVIFAFEASPPRVMYFVMAFLSRAKPASPATLPPLVAIAAPIFAASSLAPLKEVSITLFSSSLGSAL